MSSQFARFAATSPWWCFVFLVTPLVAGCGGPDGPDLATVEGTVTLDGEPLPDASVTFTPTEGSPSYGRTDEQGHFQLTYTRQRQGAELGEHVVEIRTYRGGPEGDPNRTPEKVPAQYNLNATDNPDMKRTVEAGHNEFTFELSSEGEIIDPEEAEAMGGSA